mgnify:CR=1 FL=1
MSEREPSGPESKASSEWPPLYFAPAKPPELIHPLVLAYVGDTLHDLFVRQYLIALPNHRPHHLHREASAQVSAKAQAKILERLMPVLTDEEKNIVRRGRNVKSGTPAKNADILEYRYSTAFECLLGYLFYKGQFQRLNDLLELSLDLDRS